MRKPTVTQKFLDIMQYSDSGPIECSACACDECSCSVKESDDYICLITWFLDRIKKRSRVVK